jgi:spore photoproduct lyase
MFHFEKIIIHRDVAGTPLVRTIRQAFNGLPLEWVDRDPEPGTTAISMRQSKRILYLTAFRGQLVKPCPGTKEYICCGYQILNTATNCPIDCSYCILQAYFNQSFIRLFANTDEIFRRLKAYVTEQKGNPVRLGTGEFTDSLALDPVTRFSSLLAEAVADCPNLVVELKTKSQGIENLMRLPRVDPFILSWSLNAEVVIQKEEQGAAGLNERLAAAEACQKKGYRLGFHFDPLIYFSGWEEAYRNTVDRLFQRIRSESIAWISLGCFRYLPDLKPIIQERFPRSRFIHEEFIPAIDGKKRYPQTLRVEMYRRMVGWIRDYVPEAMVYLCMESPVVWKKVFGFIPGEGHPTLAEMLDGRVNIKSP